jgi:HSP20 family protein
LDGPDQTNSLFGRRLPLPDSREEPFGLTEWTPPVDIAEDDKEYTIKAELPGVNKEDVKVTVEGGVLSITGERKSEKEKKDKKYHRIERSYGSFIRSFTLPEGTSTDRIGAEFKDVYLDCTVAAFCFERQHPQGSILRVLPPKSLFGNCRSRRISTLSFDTDGFRPTATVAETDKASREAGSIGPLRFTHRMEEGFNQVDGR